MRLLFIETGQPHCNRSKKCQNDQSQKPEQVFVDLTCHDYCWFIPDIPCLLPNQNEFFDYSPLRSLDATFVGFGNYSWAFKSDIVRHSLWITLQFTVLSVGLEVVSALLLAALMTKLILEGKSKFDRFLYSLVNGFIILPFATPAVCAALAWKIMLQPQFGPINQILSSKIAWFQNTPAICRSCRCLENDTNGFSCFCRLFFQLIHLSLKLPE